MNDEFGPNQGWLSRGLNTVGVVVIAWAVIAQYVRHELPEWELALALAATLAWFVLIPLRLRGRVTAPTLITVMVGGGALSACAVNGVGLIPALIAVLWLTRDIGRPSWMGGVLGVITIALVLVGDLFAPIAPLGLVAMAAGTMVAFLGGQARRQTVLSNARSRELIEEHARADVLAARAQLAHDIHDVLAHSLGGLVIQLDAVDALLDSGDTAAAAAKVRDARALAKDGLGDARRAVAALSAPKAGQPDRVRGDAVAADIAALVSAHESLGGNARLAESGHREEISGPLAMALRRAVQEGLTNARKHAPGAPVRVALRWRPDGVSVEISNPLAGQTAASGGGHGLVGMRERFSALPGGAVSSGVHGGRFVVTARAAIA
ncbi:MAG TPA: histidine kinase [Galbitalea sp.]|jgi:signal transduction histidine kinase|nr:histidine kinase [Galbitalea sp.]